MAFDYYDSYYGYYIGIEPNGQIGHAWTYYTSKGTRIRRKYFIPPDPKTDEQLRRRELFRCIVDKWHTLTTQERKNLDFKMPKHLIMTGFNWYISSYLKKTS
jgi:hypothetical protein